MVKKPASKRVREFALDTAQRTGVLDHLAGTAWAMQRLYVLMYHRVDDPEHRPWLDPELISAYPWQLEEQFRIIATNYQPVSAEDVVETIEGGHPLPKRAVLVTVDDGYRDFAEVIFPCAQRFGIRPVLFVPTAFVGQGIFWWDKLHQAVHSAPRGFWATPLGEYPLGDSTSRVQVVEDLSNRLKLLPFMEAMQIVDGLYARVDDNADMERSTLDWDELRSLARQGATIAAHTHTHPLLSRIPYDEACVEIRSSQALIQTEIGSALPVFAYPDGKAEFITPELMTFLSEEGFKFAVTTLEGSVSPDPAHALSFPRLAVRPSLSLVAFQFRLTPAYPR